MKFSALDDEVFVGDTYEDVVRDMASRKLEEPRSLESYMTMTATRARDMYGSEVRTTDTEAFIVDLCAEGLLVEEDA